MVSYFLRNVRENAFEIARVQYDVNKYAHAIYVLLFSSSVSHFGIYEPKRFVAVGRIPRVSLHCLFAMRYVVNMIATSHC